MNNSPFTCLLNNCLWSTTKKELSKLLNIDLIRILSDKNQQKRVSWKQLFPRHSFLFFLTAITIALTFLNVILINLKKIKIY